jgi:hypothetical protein
VKNDKIKIRKENKKEIKKKDMKKEKERQRGRTVELLRLNQSKN